MERSAERHGATTLEPALGLEVERERARFGAWYELFPRSFGGFTGVTEQLPKLKGCDAHFSVIPSGVDERLYKKLGVFVSCEPRYEQTKMYHK